MMEVDIPAIGTSMPRSRLATIVLAAALLLPLGVPSNVTPAQAATGTGGCPSHLVPATPFTDTVRSIHRAAIDCAVWWRMVEGRTPTTFSPSTQVTRGQTAAMIARLLRTTGHAPSSVPPSPFTDIRGIFEADIELLAALGIVEGTSATRYEPNRYVTRAQMASILARTFASGYRSPLPAGPLPFTDVSPGSVHADAIARVAAAGITTGVTPTRFQPNRNVPREQMASFVTRSTTVLVDRSLATRPTARPRADDAYASRTRAAWVHLFDGTLKTRAGVRAMVDELARADANVVYAQVVRRHDAYYPSSVLPRTPDPAVAPSFDLVAELITAAHARGIEVHAWFGVAPTWHPVYASLTRPPGWMYTAHGPTAPVADRWVTRTAAGTWTDYLDPGVPQVRSHVAAVVGELARRYPQLDGIHLDYTRYDGADKGYNPIALERYRAETGAVGTPAPTDTTWSNWRRLQTRRVVVAAQQAIAATGNDVELSAAVISWGNGPATPTRAGFTSTATYTQTFQDWDDWVRNGRLDAVVPMNYFREADATQAAWFDRWIAYERALAAGSSVQVVPGPAGYLNAPGDALAQTRAAMRVDGASVYSFQQPTLDSSRGIWNQLAGTRWGYHPTR
jgi:uncharacterized lipoprotein YddW (UPF0748 family)